MNSTTFLLYFLTLGEDMYVYRNMNDMAKALVTMSQLGNEQNERCTVVTREFYKETEYPKDVYEVAYFDPMDDYKHRCEYFVSKEEMMQYISSYGLDSFNVKHNAIW